MKTNNFHNSIRNDLKDHKEWLESLTLPETSQHQNLEKPQKTTKNSEIEESEKKRWEHLYDLNKIQNDTRKFISDAKRLQEQKETLNCTFQPKILDSSLKMAKNYSKVDFHTRNEFWEKDKQHRIKQIYENKKDKELLHCTFKPKIIENDIKLKSDCKNVREKSGVDKFIERQKLARLEKMRKKDILNGKIVKKLKIKGKSYGFRKENRKNKKSDMEKGFFKLKGGAFGDSVLELHLLLNDLELRI